MAVKYLVSFGLAGFGRELDLSEGEIRRGRHQTEQAEQKRAHIKFLDSQNRPLP